MDRGNRFLTFLDRFRDMAFLVGKFLFAALLLQAAVTYYVPSNLVEPLLGRGSALSVLFATLISVPLPLPQVAAPALIKGLLASGMSPGAGMAMLIGGPVTSIPALSALLGRLRPADVRLLSRHRRRRDLFGGNAVPVFPRVIPRKPDAMRKDVSE